MEFTLRVTTRPRPEAWPSPAVVIIVIIVIVTIVAVRLGYLPPDWIMITLGAGLTDVRALPGRPDSPREIRRA